MNDHTLYFAYGSNMGPERFKLRILSARRLCIATLAGHELKFHKISKDGSGKCDAAFTDNSASKVHGVLYSVETGELKALDSFEGRGHGYERRRVTVLSTEGETFEAETYTATNIDPDRRPFDWYKEHVLQGAKRNGLPSDYIAMIEAVTADADPDIERRTRELAIYLQPS
jgi:gamma-glutamylcyclotransferase (GGCT)/AIG2-like uncharacterized protein YtfP